MEEEVELDPAHLAANHELAEEAMDKATKRGRAASAVVAVIVHAIIVILLTLFFILPQPKEVPAIVAATSPGQEPDGLDKKDFARSVQQKPQPAQSASRVQPIASNLASAVAVPSIEDPVEEPLGIGVDFGRGFGYGRGSGGGGGGGTISFFGSTAKANRVVFVVDFSGSMKQTDQAGKSRLELLKNELIKSITKLPKGMQFQIIYYSHAPWLGGETLYTAPTRFADDPSTRVPWMQATKDDVEKAVAHIRAGTPDGATLWGPPLEIAFAMRPPPSLVWLLSDGDAQDREEVVDDLARINPRNIPINTIGMEIPGPAFNSLVQLARKTGGQAAIISKGRLHSGAAALRFATDEFDPDPDL